MSSQTDSSAFRALVVLGAILGVLLLLRSCKWEFPKETPITVAPTPTPSPSGFAGFVPASPPPTSPVVQPAPVKREEPVEVEAVRPRIVETPPPVAQPEPPRSVTVRVEPRKWSALVVVPPGKRGRFTFSLGRMEIEINGRDAGIVYRSPLMEPSNINPGATRVKPFAMFDKSPRTLTFGPEVRTLRFWSLEKTSEDIVIEWDE